MGEVIVVTSGKGGVGKTTTSANIGTGLASLGKKVVLIDTDIGLRNLDVVMGLENRIVYDLVDLENCFLASKKYFGYLKKNITIKVLDKLPFIIPNSDNLKTISLSVSEYILLPTMVARSFTNGNS